MHAGGVDATGQRLLGIARLENRLRGVKALPLLHQTQPSRLRRWGIPAFRACSIISSSIKNCPDLRHQNRKRLRDCLDQQPRQCTTTHFYTPITLDLLL